MTIDIWSDIMCPFCYMGKRKLEAALEETRLKDEVKIQWHSFQLDPTLHAQTGKDLFTYLAEKKGWSRDHSVKLHTQLTAAAAQDGLTYNFDKAVVANSFDAHRLIQLAKRHGLDGAVEELLFKAYFTDGKDVSDHNTLMQIGIAAGLRAVEIGEMLNSDNCADEVRKDIAQAQAYGINGVPFFVINGAYGISGAQPKEVFVNALNQIQQEVNNNGACSTDGLCDL